MVEQIIAVPIETNHPICVCQFEFRYLITDFRLPLLAHKPLKSDNQDFLFHLKSSFCSQDI